MEDNYHHLLRIKRCHFLFVLAPKHTTPHMHKYILAKGFKCRNT